MDLFTQNTQNRKINLLKREGCKMAAFPFAIHKQYKWSWIDANIMIE